MNAWIDAGWTFMQRVEEELLPPDRFVRTDRRVWIRMSLLVWVGIAILITAAGVLAVAARRGNDPIAVAAIFLFLFAAGLVLQARKRPMPRLHSHGLLFLVVSTGVLVDVAAGGSGLGALALMPFLFALAFLLLPEREVAIWWLLGLGALAACSLAPPSVVGTTAVAVPLACSIALALLIGLLVLAACDKLRAATREVQVQALADADAARRERRRIDQFVAMPGDWYWETDSELRLTFLSPGFATYLAITEGVVLGRSLETLLLGRFPGVRGLVSVVRSMRRQLAFAHYLFAWNPDQASFGVVRIRAWPSRNGRGQFLGYRGSACDISSKPFVAPTRSQESDAVDAGVQLPALRPRGDSVTPPPRVRLPR